MNRHRGQKGAAELCAEIDALRTSNAALLAALEMAAKALERTANDTLDGRHAAICAREVISRAGGVNE